MHPDIINYNNQLVTEDKEICTTLASLIDTVINDSKIWHAHPVWFIDGNPIVGFTKQKTGIRLMFWSGADFDEEKLLPGTGKFKDASIFFTSPNEINATEIKRWLKKSKTIQWDYKNLVKRKGKLELLKNEAV